MAQGSPKDEEDELIKEKVHQQTKETGYSLDSSQRYPFL